MTYKEALEVIKSLLLYQQKTENNIALCEAIKVLEESMTLGNFWDKITSQYPEEKPQVLIYSDRRDFEYGRVYYTPLFDKQIDEFIENNADEIISDFHISVNKGEVYVELENIKYEPEISLGDNWKRYRDWEK